MDTFSWQTIKFLKTFLQTPSMESNNTLRLLCVYCGKTLRISLSQLLFRWYSLLYLHNCLSIKSDLFWERFCEVYRDKLSTEQQGRERKQSTAQYREISPPQWVWSGTIASYCNKENYNNWTIKGQTISLQLVVGHKKSAHKDHMDLNLRTAFYVFQIRYIYLVQISSPPQKGLTPSSMLPYSKQQIHQRQVP